MVTEKNTVKNDKTGGRVLVGEVVSDKMEKTVIVKIVRTLKHPIYGKIIRRYSKFKVHDEHSVAKLGDQVEVTECRPLSKTKHMTLVRVLSH
ncbi:30S ribosomal protein S17 [Candidatus Dependentiae bacterium]|nr:30S ribosomal protein S17 [Candidatus Dependentiae bacterium]